jgi:hypothetical protein
MKTKDQFNPALGNISKAAVIIDKFHRCTDCPIRELAIKQPRSLFARIHRWHKTWWPGWKAHEARACAYAEGIKAQA